MQEKTEKWVLIDSDGLLFRGLTANHPLEVWDYPQKRWVRYRDTGVKEHAWGVEITQERAKQLKSDNPHAEHYLYYDKAPWL